MPEDLRSTEPEIEDLEGGVSILLVDDQEEFLHTAGLYLERRGLHVTCTADPLAALRLLREHSFDILVTDIKMPRLDGISLATEARALLPELSIVLITAFGSMEEAIQAVRLHAFDFLLKPLELQQLHRVIRKIVRGKALLKENLLLKKELRERGYMGEFVGISRPVQEIYETIHKISNRDTPISIEGESGTGKGLLAKTIHKYSPRKTEPFVEVNLGAIVPQLMESELFGHVKGAFTGAIRDNLGIILSAHGGTLFLDEIAEIGPELQVKLLRVFQDKVVRPVGGKQEIPADVRIITATNRPLKEAVEKGDLREDFYYRIRVLPIRIPPLRERKEDVPVLVGHILKRLHQEGKSHIQAVSPQAMNLLLSYDWPGNVRELENLLERCAATASGERIEAYDLPAEMVNSLSPGPRDEAPLRLADLELEAVRRALARTDGNKKRAAELLGIDKSTLHRKLRRHGLDRF
ncbi:MAG: sigma-54-dependent transcriptional regulator [Desulfobacteraceae bacterium]